MFLKLKWSQIKRGISIIETLSLVENGCYCVCNIMFGHLGYMLDTNITSFFRVLLVDNASPNSITAFHDAISNEIPNILGRWSFELKIFKSNTQNLQSSQSSFLYNLALSHEPNKVVTLVNKSAIVTVSDIPKALIDNGCSNGSVDSLDHIIQTKLQSLWLLRQTLKGENGNSYELMNGNLIIRTINVFLHGTFKAFLIQLEYTGTGNGLEKIQEFTEALNMPGGKLCTGKLNEKPNYLGDLAVQYTEALQY